ncbi:MAG TPA: MMPL family transporter [Candidatus Saccharimonadales bacterium]|nr:MMPL family transporter [Candidatus Saccharimonadales bacterium]
MDPGREYQRARIFLRIGDYAARRYGFVFLVTTLLVFGAVALGTSLRLDTDILDLVPRGNPKVDAFRTSLEEFGGIDYLMVLVEPPGGRTADEYQEFADAFAERLTALPDVQSVDYRLGAQDALLDLFRRYALLFVPPERLPELKRMLSERGIRDAVAEDRRILMSPSSAFLKDLVRRDPLGIGRFVLGRLLVGRQGLRLNPVDGYYMSVDSSALLLLVKPARPAQELAFTADLMKQVKRAEAAAREEVGKDGLDTAGLTVSYGGSYAVTLEDSDLIRGDIRNTAILSFAGVMLVYLVGYRRLGAIMYTVIPLVVAQALTFALAALTLGRLNSASSGFVAMLMGLGTDFTIVMYARYVEERRSGYDVGPAMTRMMGEASLGVFTGAITSAGTFYAMCTTEFLGLKELGFLIGSGMILCLATILILLPAMIQWNEGRRPQRRPASRLHVQSFGVEKLIPIAARYRKTTLALTGALLAALGFSAWMVPFSDSVEDLRSPDNRGALVTQKVARKFGGNLSVMMAIIKAPTVQDALDKMKTVATRAQPWLDDGTLSGVDSLIQYLPPASDQEVMIEALHEGSGDPDGVFSADRIARALHRELDRQGFRVQAFDEYLPELRSMLEVDAPVGVAQLKGEQLASLLGRYLRKGGKGYHAAFYFYLDHDRWKRSPPPGFAEAISAGDPTITVTGVNVVSKELRGIFKRDALKAVFIGFGLVTILLIIDLRSVRYAVLINAQVIFGIVMMFGIMGLMGIGLNFVNSFTATMVLGFGVDYGIHMVHRLRSSGGRIDSGVLETGKAVTIAALTTIAGFGALTFSNFPAMKSVGIVAILGASMCLLTALAFIPATMSRPEPER